MGGTAGANGDGVRGLWRAFSLFPFSRFSFFVSPSQHPKLVYSSFLTLESLLSTPSSSVEAMESVERMEDLSLEESVSQSHSMSSLAELAARIPQSGRTGNAKAGPSVRSFSSKQQQRKQQHEKEESRPGLVLWTNVCGKWNVLLQVSYSKMLFTFKADPFRGKKEGDETRWKTAVRETYEESEGVIDLRDLVEPPEGTLVHNGLFHLDVTFAAGELAQLVHDFRLSEQAFPETEGLVWVEVPRPAGFERTTHAPRRLRLGSQVIRDVLSVDTGSLGGRFSMERTMGDVGRASFKAGGGPALVDEVQPASSLWRRTLFVHDLGDWSSHTWDCRHNHFLEKVSEYPNDPPLRGDMIPVLRQLLEDKLDFVLSDHYESL